MVENLGIINSERKRTTNIRRTKVKVYPQETMKIAAMLERTEYKQGEGILTAEEVLAEVMHLSSAGKDCKALDVLFDYACLTDLPADEEMALQVELMSKADTKKLSSTVLLALLTVSSPYCDRMPERKEFFKVVEKELVSRMGKKQAARNLKGLDCHDGGAGSRWGLGIIKRVFGMQ